MMYLVMISIHLTNIGYHFYVNYGDDGDVDDDYQMVTYAVVVVVNKMKLIVVLVDHL